MTVMAAPVEKTQLDKSIAATGSVSAWRENVWRSPKDKSDRQIIVTHQM